MTLKHGLCAIFFILCIHRIVAFFSFYCFQQSLTSNKTVLTLHKSSFLLHWESIQRLVKIKVFLEGEGGGGRTIYL